MATHPGIFQAKKKDGSIYYRASVTYKNKHISLGSFADEKKAAQAYQDACQLLQAETLFLPSDYPDLQRTGVTVEPDDTSARQPATLSFQKWVILTNCKNNGLYIKTPIYLRNKYFEYYLSPTDVLLFDIDDLFYYSHHSIMRRGNHLFVSDYGMQVNIASRYGIKNFAVKDRDYRFINGDDHDLRYANLEIINRYNGVCRIATHPQEVYQTKIHVNGDLLIGRYPTEEQAAIAYNKAIDILQKNGVRIRYTPNYIDTLSASAYASLYMELTISDTIYRQKG